MASFDVASTIHQSIHIGLASIGGAGESGGGGGGGGRDHPAPLVQARPATNANLPGPKVVPSAPSTPSREGTLGGNGGSWGAPGGRACQTLPSTAFNAIIIIALLVIIIALLVIIIALHVIQRTHESLT
jgi:hypothetical protein